jgi:hypothetical protein
VPALAGLIHPASRTIPNFVAIAAALFDPTISFKQAWNRIGSPEAQYDTGKATRVLGLAYRPFHEQFVDAARSLAAAGNGILTEAPVVQALTQQ